MDCRAGLGGEKRCSRGGEVISARDLSACALRNSGLCQSDTRGLLESDFSEYPRPTRVVAGDSFSGLREIRPCPRYEDLAESLLDCSPGWNCAPRRRRQCGNHSKAKRVAPGLGETAALELALRTRRRCCRERGEKLCTGSDCRSPEQRHRRRTSDRGAHRSPMGALGIERQNLETAVPAAPSESTS